MMDKRRELVADRTKQSVGQMMDKRRELVADRTKQSVGQMMDKDENSSSRSDKTVSGSDNEQ